MTYDASYHRSERLRVMARWSEVGVLESRGRLPVEQAFVERVEQAASPFFRPVPVNDLDSVEFHRALSYLLDAFDSLPWRVDVAFDSTWKAFELATTRLTTGNVTDRLRSAATGLDPDVLERLCASLPVQSCEYLFKRLVTDAVSGHEDQRLGNRVRGLNDQAILSLISHLNSAYADGSSTSRRKGALLIRRALRGEVLRLGPVADFQLGIESRARVLISLFLYTSRNERFHGASFSPFVSSAASLSTYTHPFFAFLASYYLLLCTWSRTLEGVFPESEGLLVSFDANLKLAIGVFGRHWER